MDIKMLDSDIKSNKIKNLYLFYGPESFLMENKLDSIKSRLIPKDFETLAYVKFEGKEAKFDEFEDECAFLPFGAEKKLLLVKNTNWLSNSKSAEFKRLKEICEDIPEYLFIVIIENDFDKKKEKNIDFIEKNGEIVLFEMLSVTALTSWVDKIFSENGKIVSQSDISYIINACSQSMGRIYSEVNKLIVFSGENEKILRDDIEALVAKTSEYRIYELFDEIIEVRADRALEKLETLLASGEKPTSIIAGISGKLYELLTVKLLNSDRVPNKEISSYFDFPRPDFVINKMITQSKRYGEKYLKRMIRKAIDFDKRIKSGKISGELAAEMYILELVKKD